MNHAKTYYWMRPCIHCNGQGRLLIMKNLSTNSLYLHCEECEWGWRQPDRTDDVEAAFLTLQENFQAQPASAMEIEQAGWSGYVSGLFQE